MNGVYDVSPSPTYDRGAQSGTNIFNYTFDAGGGTCDSIACHSGLISATKKWGNSSLTPTFSFFPDYGCYGVRVFAASQTCSPASACNEPYTYLWDFGDGTIINGGTSEVYDYGTPGSFNIILTVISGTW